jgi:hypothetical protein
MERTEQGIKKSIFGSQRTLGVLRTEGLATKLLVRAEACESYQ